mgnify:FL=1
MKLYTYWRSSAAYRVRIALNLKGLELDHAIVNLMHDGGAQSKPEYRQLNPQMLVPALELDSGGVLTQSLAIIEYLEETCAEPPLLPTGPLGRARVRAMALAVACDIHPLNNLRVLRYLKNEFDVSEDQKRDWYRHWVSSGLEAIETMLRDSPHKGRFCHNDNPGLADICLVPQVYNARRFDIPLTAFPCVANIDGACLELDAFDKARPEKQPDAD